LSIFGYSSGAIELLSSNTLLTKNLRKNGQGVIEKILKMGILELLGNKLKIFETLTWQAFERSFTEATQTQSA